ncbi:MAG: histidine kinase [Chitinophagaceae bacterium]|nr:histidine kinase [Chitinophagaceae bacterium]
MLVFLIAGISYYFILRYVLVNQIDDDLKIEQREIQAHVLKYNRLPDELQVKDQVIRFQITTDSIPEKFGHIDMTEEHGTEEFRSLEFFIPVQSQMYKVTVLKSMEATEDLIQAIIAITLVTLLLLLVLFLLINRMILRKLWKPFYKSLDVMRSFQLGGKHSLNFPATNIEEFNIMNDTLKQAFQKAEQDYITLKEFTENASHELQTPLAIIRSKLDLLIQDQQLSAAQSLAVLAAYDSVQKLAHLNTSLLLLAKIDNRQFSEISAIDLKAVVQNKLLQLEELFSSKSLQIVTDLKPATILMNETLCELVLNNLISNAIHHNVEGGTVIVNLQSHKLIIANTATEAALDNEKMFDRFSNKTPKADHTGLGLSIIKQVCDVSHISCTYKYLDSKHHFIIEWVD